MSCRCLLRGVQKKIFFDGMVLAEPKQLIHIQPDAQVYVLNKEELGVTHLSSLGIDLNSTYN
jgi:translation elongation factor EF-Tu-like GTPase